MSPSGPLLLPARRLLSWAWAPLLVVLASAPPSAAQMAIGTSPEEWMVLSIDGSPGGYLHMILRDDEEDRIASWMDMRLKLSRVGATVEISMEMTSLEDADGQVLRMTSMMATPGETRAVGVVDGDTLLVEVQEAGGGTRSFEQPWCIDCKGVGYWARRTGEWLATAQPGDTFETRSYDLSMGTGITVTQELIAIEPDGSRILEGVTDLFPGNVQTQHMLVDGTLLAFSMSMAGLKLELTRATREEALAAYEGGGFAPEVFAQTTFRPDVPLPRPRSLDRVVYGLTRKDTAIPLPEFQSPRQSIVDRGEQGRVSLEVRRVLPERTTSTTSPGEAYSAPNATVQSDDERIIALADELVGDAADPWEKARLLERGVYEYIDKKSMDVAFATASETCLSRTGDCTEHAVLLAALARTQDIPARVAMGVLYLGGIFGGHAWTEVWIGDEWIALDGTLGLGSVDAAHIRFGASSLEGLGMGAEMYAALAGLGNLDVAILETESGGRVSRPGAGDGVHFVIDGATLTSRDYGFRMDAPDGFQWDPEVPDWTDGYVARALGADGRMLYVLARAVGYAFDADDLRAFLGELEIAIPVRVDGRSGLVGEGGRWTLGVLDGDTVIQVRFDATDDDEALETLLGLAESMTFSG